MDLIIAILVVIIAIMDKKSLAMVKSMIDIIKVNKAIH